MGRSHRSDLYSKFYLAIAINILVVLFYFSCSPSGNFSDLPSTTNEESPVVWAGAGQAIRPNELMVDPYAYPIYAQALDDAGNPLSGVLIGFSVLYGSGSFSVGSSYTGQNGIAMNGFFRSSVVGTNTIRITHGNKVNDFDVYVINDNESSNAPSGYKHEKDGAGNEILGDGFNDSDEVGENKNVKNVNIELDYINSISGNVLTEIMDEAKTILETGGFKVTIQTSDILTIDNISMYDIFSDDMDGRKKMKAVLFDKRNNKSAFHAILANKHSNSNLYGITIQYYSPYPNGDGWTHDACARGATGLSRWDPNYSQNFKDSTGVLVFTGNIPADSYYPSGWGWTRNKFIAWTLAHEIGHALGISTHINNWGPNDGLMRLPSFDNWYTNFNHFNGQELGHENGNSVNTRDMLGIQTIDFAN